MAGAKEKAFDYIHLMPRSEKPRDRGLTEVRDIKGRGMAELEDICQTAGEYIDVYKMACATQRLLPKEIVKKRSISATDLALKSLPEAFWKESYCAGLRL